MRIFLGIQFSNSQRHLLHKNFLFKGSAINITVHCNGILNFQRALERTTSVSLLPRHMTEVMVTLRLMM